MEMKKRGNEMKKLSHENEKIVTIYLLSFSKESKQRKDFFSTARKETKALFAASPLTLALEINPFRRDS